MNVSGIFSFLPCALACTVNAKAKVRMVKNLFFIR